MNFQRTLGHNIRSYYNPRENWRARPHGCKGPRGPNSTHGLPEELWTSAWVGYPTPSWSSPECPYPLLGRDLLTKMGAQICFRPGGAKILDKEGKPIQVLVLSLEDEYCLHQIPPAPMTDIDRWLQEFPQAWAETGNLAGPTPTGYMHRTKTRGRPCQGPPIPHASRSVNRNHAPHTATTRLRHIKALPIGVERSLADGAKTTL